jgi:uncharacterized protein YcaQ
VHTHLQKHRPVRAVEFEHPGHTPGGWWNWKEEKAAREALLLLGEVNSG